MFIFDFPKKDQTNWSFQKKLLTDLKFFEKCKKFSYDGIKSKKLDEALQLIENTKIKGGFSYDPIAKVSKPMGALHNWIMNWIKAGQAVVGVHEVNEMLKLLDKRMAYKLETIEKKEQELLANYIPQHL